MYTLNHAHKYAPAKMSRARTLSDIIASVPAAVRWKLDEEIDFEHRDGRGLIIHKHLGRIADVILDWQDVVADHLGLSDTDRNDIVERYRDKPKLQRREALSRWKSGLGKAATYRALIQIFLKAGKVDYAEFVCDLFKDNTGDHGVPGSTTPTTPVSHAQSASATTTTTAAHIDFSELLGPDDLAQWLRQEYGANYPEDVEKLCKERINGEQLLNNISILTSELKFSLGFKIAIEKRVGKLKGPATAGVMPPIATGSNGAASLSPLHTPPSFTEGTGPQSPSSNGQASGANTADAQAKPAPVSTVLKVTDRLSPNHLQQVLDLVWGARSKYYNIGLGLDLPSDTIDAIASGNSYKPDPVFTEMIKECLNKGLITQEKLSKAVSSQQVGFAYLSNDILTEKFTVPQTPRSVATPGGATSGHASLPPTQHTPPSSAQTQHNADFDRFEVKHHFVSRLEWIDSDSGDKKNVRVYNGAAWRWSNVATNLGLGPGEIESIRRNHFSDDERVTDVFRHWFDNANNLPNSKKYPKKWSGLIKLLSDSELGQLSEEVKTALSATYSNVRGTL